MRKNMKNKVALLLGSESDRHLIDPSLEYYNYFDIDIDVKILSAHRNPKEVAEFAKNARSQNYNWENSSDIFYSAVTKLNV